LDRTVVPDDIKALLQKAEELHRAGREREAWALCFSIFTGIFTRHWFLTIPPEATEYETLALIRKKTKALGTAPFSEAANQVKGFAGFEQFVRHWIVFAYGGQEPAAGTFEEALDSCRELMEGGAGA
jgi:hypothetical protein